MTDDVLNYYSKRYNDCLHNLNKLFDDMAQMNMMLRNENKKLNNLISALKSGDRNDN